MGQEDQIKLEEIKVAYKCRCEPIRLMPWLDYSTYFAYRICHNLLLGLHIPKYLETLKTRSALRYSRMQCDSRINKCHFCGGLQKRNAL